ncbi:recombinase family protein [Streptosporangium sandarakinum]|uniref:recombinase family protein n=1 Tax=Streptosporangium sandarakinum TaxID=1260955 RepID=UPI0037AD7658
MANLVYKRVSIDRQSTARQDLVLSGTCIEDPVVFEEDGGTSSRLHSPQRPKVVELLAYARPGDTVHISETFRLVRGAQHILDVLDVLHRERLALRIHDGAFSDKTAAGIPLSVCPSSKATRSSFSEFLETAVRSGYGRPVTDDTLPSTVPGLLRTGVVAALKERGWISSPEVEAAFAAWWSQWTSTRSSSDDGDPTSTSRVCPTRTRPLDRPDPSGLTNGPVSAASPLRNPPPRRQFW